MRQHTLTALRIAAVLREKELWLLILAGMLFFYRPLFLNETFFFRDLLYDFIPQKQMLLDFAEKGEWPLWDIYRHGGQPYFADPNNSVFHPVNLLFFILPFFRAFNLILVGHALLYLISAYLLARILGLSPKAAMMSATVYGLCGCSLSLLNLFGRFLAMAYLPLLLLFWHLYLAERRRKWLAFSVAFGVLQVLCGAPEVNVLNMLLLLGWTLCFPYDIPRMRRCLQWGALNAFILGVSMIQLLPTVEMVRQSSRGAGMEYWEFTSNSLRLKRLPELVAPNFFGYVDQLPFQTYYWSYILRDGDDYSYIVNIYFGATALILGIFGGLDPRCDSRLTRPARRMLLFIFAAVVLLSLGRFLPGFALLYRLPLMTLFRYPIKFMIAGLLPLALLVGHTAEMIFDETRDMAVFRRVLSACAIAAALFAASFTTFPAFADAFERFFFWHSADAVMAQGLQQAFTHVAAMLMLAALFAVMMRRSSRWPQWGLAGVLLLDLGLAGMRVNPTAPEAWLTEIPAAAQAVKRQIGDGRLFRVDPPRKTQILSPSEEIFWGYRWRLETLTKYAAAFYRIPVLFHDDYVGLENMNMLKLNGLVKQLAWPQRLPLLAASGVTTVITHERVALPDMPLAAELPNRSNTPFYLYRLTRPADCVRFVSAWKFTQDEAEAIRLLLAPSFDPARQVVLHAPELRAIQQPECAPAEITALTVKSHVSAYRVTNACDGFVVFAEPFYPGWRVRVDGRRVPILRANMAFSAVLLPPGTHLIERRYVPLSLIFGAFASLLSCGILGWHVARKAQ